MINDMTLFNAKVNEYCADLPKHWKDEKFKWEAVKQFQDNFDIDATDLADNLDKSINKRVMAGPTAPRYMLVNLTKFDPITMKQALIDLFDKTKALPGRLKAFLDTCNNVKDAVNASGTNSYGSSGQSNNSAMDLLALRYPDDYFGYRLNIASFVNKFFDMGYPLTNKQSNRILDSENLHKEIRDLLIQNNNLKTVVAGLTSGASVYDDDELFITTSDFCFWLLPKNTNQQIEDDDEDDAEEIDEELETSFLQDSNTNYWWVTTKQKIFSFSTTNEGQVVKFDLLNKKGTKKRISANFVAAKKDELVIWYEATPTLKIVGLASVDYPSDGTAIGIKLNKKLKNPLPIKEAEKSPIFLNSQPCRLKYQGTLFLLTKEEYSNLYSLIKGINSDLDDLAILPEPTTETSTFEVYYGIPGCGKSHSLNERLATDGYDEIVRTVFYPEYSNADFVGQLMPQKHGGNMDFVVKPGPFARALALAFSKPNKKVALVIEEINRGNASAIFGEIFQLLDVVNNQNRSQYSIFSPVLTEYLKEKCQIDLEEVYIPGNLSIFGTMNTSDQNVFKFDTAFKRRWKMHRLTNDNGGFDPTQHDFDVPNLDIKWSEFVKKINDAILKNDLEEDRQLGLWFYQEDKNDKDLTKSFGEKVLEYLWNDVTKYNHEILFNKDIKSFDELLKMYFDTTKSKQIFNEEILK